VEDYLCYDSSHKYSRRNISNKVTVVGPDDIVINGQPIHIFRSRKAAEIDWRSVGVQYVLECTGAFLSTETAGAHDVDHVILSAPPSKCKVTPTYIYGVNHDQYHGEKVVSASSCTTNCMAPAVKLVDDAFGLKKGFFTTIHATTGSQSVVDVITKSSRTHRSIINNMIPHSTGASKSVYAVLPHLEGKIWGTSVRVPTINCSLLDLNVEVNQEGVTLDDVVKLFKNSKYAGSVYAVNEKALTSVDFLTTVTPSILDTKASMTMGTTIKMMLWYDNEWSYSAQCLRVMESMWRYNEDKKAKSFRLSNDLSLRALNFEGKNVVARFDFNVPVDEGKVTDEYRITSALPSINYMLSEGASRVVLVCHFGRPKGAEAKYSVEFMVEILERLLKRTVKFLPDGVSRKTLDLLAAEPDNDGKVYLLENIRFHPEETKYDKASKFSAMYQELGDVIIADCFGCVHRNHTSIVHLQGDDSDSSKSKQFGYGFLIEEEVHALSKLLNNDGKKVLGIMGGAKIADKQPMIECLSKMDNTRVFVGGGLTRGLGAAMPSMPRNVMLARDAYGAENFDLPPQHIVLGGENGKDGGFDIGPAGLRDLMGEIDAADVIFWNGCLGVIEDSRYRVGSKMIVDYLLAQTSKQVVIGGGETASLFAGIADDAPHVYISTGGGALLEHMESIVMQKPTVPGLACFGDFTERERRLSISGSAANSPSRNVWSGSIVDGSGK
jgi:glyceraldehyde 3-phosphate dehydrogenase